MSKPVRVSVILCTHGDRRASLEQLIASLAWQTMSFELVVVLGPASAATQAFVKQLPPEVRRATCDTLNISRARNRGITVSNGDIVVFIDDDALPIASNWLENLTAPLREGDNRVAAVGSLVYRADTEFVEFGGGATSASGFQRFGEDDGTVAAPDGTAWIPRIPGGNCALSRSAVMRLGGFDEQYTYYLDETDLCMRLAAAKQRVIYTDRAPIRHYAAASSHGPAGQRNRYPVSRSDAYFVLRHAPGPRWRRMARAIGTHSQKHFVREGRAFFDRQELSRAALVQFRLNCWRGLGSGMWAGLTQGPILPLRATPPASSWRSFAPPRTFILNAVSEAAADAAETWTALLKYARSITTNPWVGVVSELPAPEAAAGAIPFPLPAPAGDPMQAVYLPAAPEIARAAEEAAAWVARVTKVPGLRPRDRFIWPGSAWTGALIGEGLCARVDVLGPPLEINEAANETAPTFPPAVRPTELLVRLLVRRLAAAPEGQGRLDDAFLSDVLLALLRHCLTESSFELAVTFGNALRRHVPEDSAEAVEIDYHVARALRELKRADEARDLYESIRGRGRQPGAAKSMLAGARFHLAVDAHARNQDDRAADLLEECLRYLPDHREAHRLLEDIRASMLKGSR